MKDDEISSPSKSDSPTKKSSRNKRKIPRICGIKVKTFWKIRKQFMSSIYILNGLFLILITIIVLVYYHPCHTNQKVNQIGFRYIIFKFTESKISDNQQTILNTMAMGLASSLGSQLSYYLQVGSLFGRLILDMLYQHTDTKIFNVYPLKQPDPNLIPNLTEWGSSGTPGVNVELQEYYKANLKALNYFSDELLSTSDGIPIHSLYASFLDSSYIAFLSLGYPSNLNFERPSYLNDNWYSRALKSSTGKAISYRVENSTVFFQFSEMVLKPDNTPLCVVLVEVEGQYIVALLDKYYTVSGNAYGSILADSSGNIIAASSNVLKTPVLPSGSVPTVNSSTIGLDNNTWTLLLNQMLLVNSTPFSYFDPDGNLIYITANQIELPTDIQIYDLVIYPESVSLIPINNLRSLLSEEAIPNVLIVFGILFILFIIVFTFTIKRSRKFIDPFLAISDYAEKKIDQISNPNTTNREIEPITLIQGEDEIGEFVSQFKKLISGLSAIKNETQETIPKFEDEKLEYPRNYYKGKFMPWRNSIQLLQTQHAPVEGVEVVKEKKQVGGTKLNLIKKK